VVTCLQDGAISKAAKYLQAAGIHKYGATYIKASSDSHTDLNQHSAPLRSPPVCSNTHPRLWEYPGRYNDWGGLSGGRTYISHVS